MTWSVVLEPGAFFLDPGRSRACASLGWFRVGWCRLVYVVYVVYVVFSSVTLSRTPVFIDSSVDKVYLVYVVYVVFHKVKIYVYYSLLYYYYYFFYIIHIHTYTNARSSSVYRAST